MIPVELLSKLNDLDWKFCSHVSMKTYSSRLSKASINGSTIYRHNVVNKSKVSEEYGKGATHYSLTVNGPDLKPNEIEQLFK